MFEILLLTTIILIVISQILPKEESSEALAKAPKDN